MIVLRKAPRPKAYSYSVTMAPLPIKSSNNTAGCLVACCPRIHALLAALCSCFLICVFLCIKHLRNRPLLSSSSSSNMSHIKTLVSVPAMEEKSLGGGLMIFDPGDPINPIDRQLLTELLNPLLVDGGSRRANLMTSGYLAAKAKMEAPAIKTITLDPKATTTSAQAHPLDILSDQDIQSLITSPVTDYQKAQPWSRHSSPGPQQNRYLINPLSIQPMTTTFSTTSDGFYHEPEDIDITGDTSSKPLILNNPASSLHKDSLLDETRQYRLFCDDHDARIKWRRRRTLVFEKQR